MQNFQYTFETWKRSFISAFSICMTVPLTFVNYEGPSLAERFLHNLCPCFDVVFVQLGVITRTRNNFVEIVAAS